MNTIATPMIQVSSSLHLGTVCSLMYSDIFVSLMRQNNNNLLFPKCWNCYGRHTEKFAEKNRLSDVKEAADKLVAESEDIFKNFGINFDSVTLRDDSKEFVRATIEILGDLKTKGEIFENDKNLYLKVNFEKIQDRINQIQWYPEFISKRLTNCIKTLPRFLIINKSRIYALPFNKWQIDPKISVALSFYVLNKLGLTPVFGVYGLDVVERLMILSFVISPSGIILPQKIYLHGMLLGSDKKKMSRHSDNVQSLSLHPDEIRAMLFTYSFGNNFQLDNPNQLKRVKQFRWQFINAVKTLRIFPSGINRENSSIFSALQTKFNLIKETREKLDLTLFFNLFEDIINKDICVGYIPLLKQGGELLNQQIYKELLDNGSLLFPITCAELQI